MEYDESHNIFLYVFLKKRWKDFNESFFLIKLNEIDYNKFNVRLKKQYIEEWKYAFDNNIKRIKQNYFMFTWNWNNCS